MNLAVIQGYELNQEISTAPWYAFDMIEFGENWNPILHASPRDANYNLMDNRYYNLYVTTRQDWGYGGAHGCGYLNVMNLWYDTTTSYFKLVILGTTYYQYSGYNYFMFWHYLKIYDNDFEHIGANNNHIVMYKIPAEIWIMNSDC